MEISDVPLSDPAAEKIVVKRQLLLRLDLDQPTRALLKRQIIQLRVRGLTDGY
jgi:hypothetical protein